MLFDNTYDSLTNPVKVCFKQRSINSTNSIKCGAELMGAFTTSSCAFQRILGGNIALLHFFHKMQVKARQDI